MEVYFFLQEMTIISADGMVPEYLLNPVKFSPNPCGQHYGKGRKQVMGEGGPCALEVKLRVGGTEVG